jgi:hypothetical protein
MFQHIFENRVLKELAGFVLVLNAVVLVFSLYTSYNNTLAIRTIHEEILDLQSRVEEESRLRQELFSELRHSASYLQRYNPRLDNNTALKYVCKIRECSEPPVTPELLTALIVVESGANHVAVSRKGAVGLTQVMPQIWQCKKQELLNPYRNIEIGSKILKYYIDRNGIHGGLSSYNSGRTDYALDYAHSVLAIANDLKVNKVF